MSDERPSAAPTRVSLEELRADLAAEQAALEKLVVDLDEDQWRRATPSPGWDVADQIAHLAYFDRAAASALTDPEAFRESVAKLIEGAAFEGIDQYTLGAFRSLTGAAVLEAWREARRKLLKAAATLVEGVRVDWYGPAMGAKSFLSARLMETWAHGHDVAEALGRPLEATDRLAHVARLGLATRDWSYRVRAEEPPGTTIRLALRTPRGALLRLGPDDADDAVEGDLEEFCLVVTQRRHLDDTSLEITDGGRQWLLRAQAFAGAPSDPPPPRHRPKEGP